MDETFARQLPLSRSVIDRDYATRARPNLIDELRADGDALGMVLAGGKALLAEPDDASPRLELLSGPELPEGGFGIYLGRITDGRFEKRLVIAVVFDTVASSGIDLPEERWGDLRQIAVQLDALDSGLFTQALAIANWHSSHGFSPKTGEETVPGMAGWVRYPLGLHDERSGKHVFPRTDPAIIVGVVDDQDRMLLGANASWGGERYSVLAGFVEPGESFEAAVVREVFEESGLHVVDPEYLGSQPWPFPASIMIGFTARVAPGTDPTPVPDGVEIVDLRWVSRAEIADGARTFGIPSRSSIARAIVERWYGGRLDAP